MSAIRSLPLSLRPLARPAVHLMREAPLWPRLLQGRGGGHRLLLLPAAGRGDGAARLRIWEMARALDLMGWRTFVVPPGVSLTGRQRLIRAFGPDVILMQGVRHALNRPALYPGLTIAMDMDDADFYLPHLSDAVTEAMPGIHMLIAGSRYIATWGRGAGAPEAEVVSRAAAVRLDGALRALIPRDAGQRAG